MASKPQQPGFSAQAAIAAILADTQRRTLSIIRHPIARFSALTHLLSSLPGKAIAGYISLNDSTPTYNKFLAEPDNGWDPPEASKIQADVANFISTSIDYTGWVHRAKEIRKTGRRFECVGNLTVALNVGSAYSAGMASANTLLSLIPTAGVLIGAPAKELWVLYKLCPLAGILSNMLALGGSIVPNEVGQYEKIEDFQYQGLVAVEDHGHGRDTGSFNSGHGSTDKEASGAAVMVDADGAEKFAQEVYRRALETDGIRHGTRPTVEVGLRMLMQCVAIGMIVGACFFLQAGAVLVWWCEQKYWMLIWYSITIFSSVFDNLSGVPFTRTWTIRVWRAPPLTVDDHSPWVRPPDPELGAEMQPWMHPESDEYDMSPGQIGGATPLMYPGGTTRRKTAAELQKEDFSDLSKILEGLEKGYSNRARVRMDLNNSYSQADDAFYVLLSVMGIESEHAALRVFSKVLSIGVFAVSTGLFASASLITIIEALVAATLILVAGIFGRVVAMSMTSVMMRKIGRPVLHKVVADKRTAGRYLNAIFGLRDIACEVKGHIVVHGRCVKKFGSPLRLSTIMGVLARPFDLSKLAVNARFASG